MIAGYHFEPKGDKAKVYHNYIMRRMGIWILLLVALIHAGTVCGLLNYSVAMWVCFGVMIAVTILGLVYINSNKKIKNAMIMEKQLSEEFEKEEKGKNEVSE